MGTVQRVAACPGPRSGTRAIAGVLDRLGDLALLDYRAGRPRVNLARSEMNTRNVAMSL